MLRKGARQISDVRGAQRKRSFIGTGQGGETSGTAARGRKAGIISREHPECWQTGDNNFQETVNIAAEAA